MYEKTYLLIINLESLSHLEIEANLSAKLSMKTGFWNCIKNKEQNTSNLKFSKPLIFRKICFIQLGLSRAMCFPRQIQPKTTECLSWFIDHQFSHSLTRRIKIKSKCNIILIIINFSFKNWKSGYVPIN